MRYLPLLLVAAVLTAPAAGVRAQETKEPNAVPKGVWLADLTAAKAKAKAQNKRLFVNFTGSDWCKWCVTLHKEVYDTEEFLAYADKNLVLLELDYPQAKPQDERTKAQNEKALQDFGVKGFPTIVVLRPAGDEAGRLGYMKGGPKAFLEVLEKTK